MREIDKGEDTPTTEVVLKETAAKKKLLFVKKSFRKKGKNEETLDVDVVIGDEHVLEYKPLPAMKKKRWKVPEKKTKQDAPTFVVEFDTDDSTCATSTMVYQLDSRGKNKSRKLLLVKPMSSIFRKKKESKQQNVEEPSLTESDTSEDSVINDSDPMLSPIEISGRNVSDITSSIKGGDQDSNKSTNEEDVSNTIGESKDSNKVTDATDPETEKPLAEIEETSSNPEDPLDEPKEVSLDTSNDLLLHDEETNPKLDQHLEEKGSASSQGQDVEVAVDQIGVSSENVINSIIQEEADLEDCPELIEEAGEPFLELEVNPPCNAIRQEIDDVDVPKADVKKPKRRVQAIEVEYVDEGVEEKEGQGEEREGAAPPAEILVVANIDDFIIVEEESIEYLLPEFCSAKDRFTESEDDVSEPTLHEEHVLEEAHFRDELHTKDMDSFILIKEQGVEYIIEDIPSLGDPQNDNIDGESMKKVLVPILRNRDGATNVRQGALDTASTWSEDDMDSVITMTILKGNAEQQAVYSSNSKIPSVAVALKFCCAFGSCSRRTEIDDMVDEQEYEA